MNRFKYNSSKPLSLYFLISPLQAGFFAASFIYHQRLAGYAIFTIIAEINSIFLHGRQLLLMYDVPTYSKLYKVNSALNIATYVLFRLTPFATLVTVAWRDRHRMSAFYAYALMIGSTTLLVINVVLFYRLIKRDFLSPPVPRTVKENNHNNNRTYDIMAS